MSKIRVLVVDDENEFRTVISKELANMGFSVLAARSGEEAIDKVAKEAIDVALLDIRMPGMNGIEALQIIKELSPDSEVIMLTAYSSIDSAVEAVKLGAHHYLEKPCPLDGLELFIRRAYEKKKLRM